MLRQFFYDECYDNMMCFIWPFLELAWCFGAGLAEAFSRTGLGGTVMIGLMMGYGLGLYIILVMKIFDE